MHQRNQLTEEISELEEEISSTLREFVSIPSLSSSVSAEEEIKRLERFKDQYPPEAIQRAQELIRMAEDRRGERQVLWQYLSELIETRDHLIEKRKSVDEKFSEVTAAIIDLYHRHGLPGTRAEVEAAVKNEGK